MTSTDHDICSTASGPIYIGEVTQAHVRGKIMTFWQMFYSVGSFIAYWINYITARRRTQLGNWDWKMVSTIKKSNHENLLTLHI